MLLYAVVCVSLVTIKLESGIQMELQTGQSPSLVYYLAVEWNIESSKLNQAANITGHSGYPIVNKQDTHSWKWNSDSG